MSEHDPIEAPMSVKDLVDVASLALLSALRAMERSSGRDIKTFEFKVADDDRAFCIAVTETRHTQRLFARNVDTSLTDDGDGRPPLVVVTQFFDEEAQPLHDVVLESGDVVTVVPVFSQDKDSWTNLIVRTCMHTPRGWAFCPAPHDAP